MTTLLKNAKYVDEALNVKCGDLLIDGSKISEIEDKMSGFADKTVDINGNLVIPGFKNAHTHSPMSLFRSVADDMELLTWLRTRIFPLEEKLTAEDIYYGELLAIAEYVSSGITACSDMYFFFDEMAEAIKKSGFKCVFSGAYSDADTEKESFAKLERLEQNYLKFNGGKDGISFRFGIHAEYTSSPKMRREYSKLADRYGELSCAHVSESRSEVKECFERYGVTPLKKLVLDGMFANGGVIYHGVYLTDEELELCKKLNIAIVTNPASNVKLASGIADISKMREMGIALALGTDGASSNNSLDFFKEMYLGCTLQKTKYSDAEKMPADEMFKMATFHGAKVLGLNTSTAIKVGAEADLCVIDLKMPNMQPENNLVKNLVYAGNPKNVVMTMVGGKILYDHGNFFLAEKIEDIYSRCNAAIRRMEK